MGIDRKHSPAGDLTPGPEASFSTASSSSAAYARHTFRSNTLPPPRTTSSPPASAYFTQFATDDSHVLEPTVADADSHFAYSTTLRRHHPEGPLGFPPTPRANLDEFRHAIAEEGPAGLLQRAVSFVKSYFSGSESNDYERLPVYRDEQKNTPSARFAHYPIEVSCSPHCMRCSMKECSH